MENKDNYFKTEKALSLQTRFMQITSEVAD